MSRHDVIASGELPEGVLTAVEAAGRPLCLVRRGGTVTAFDDACPHRQWPLHAGTLDGDVLTCKAHTWEWDVRTGELQRMRAPECLVMHAVTEDGGRVVVEVADDAPAAKPISRLALRARERDAA